ncbi:hypothetical protein EW146_g5249 [Bondarzewia mesenterica]|uniref:3'-5' exonuclease domain-containing protein n=1 Tax=Bondarzewia mesenterica TaxID=1095465 RepID=A0A4S4LT45_9AGAM|nr:hypothetical protein EW146_g5249 [Bondarzewia mesenterica]
MLAWKLKRLGLWISSKTALLQKPVNLPMQDGRLKPEPKMPLYTYRDSIPRPTLMYIRSEAEANELVQALNGPVGFDMEWCCAQTLRGNFAHRPTALVQICDSNTILLIQLSAMKNFPQKVKELIESPSIPKMGVCILGDGKKLYKDYGILSTNLIELGGLAYQADKRFREVFNRRRVSLDKCVTFYQDRTLDKGPVRMSNWEAVLSREQMEYAANDAHCALLIYKKILSIARSSRRPLRPSEYTTDIAVALGIKREAPAPFSEEITPSNTEPAPPPPSAQPIQEQADTLTSTRSLAVSTTVSVTEVTAIAPPSPQLRRQHLRAYQLWKNGNELDNICAALRSAERPLKQSTVMYVHSSGIILTSSPFSLPSILRPGPLVDFFLKLFL